MFALFDKLLYSLSSSPICSLNYLEPALFTIIFLSFVPTVSDFTFLSSFILLKNFWRSEFESKQLAKWVQNCKAVSTCRRECCKVKLPNLPSKVATLQSFCLWHWNLCCTHEIIAKWISYDNSNSDRHLICYFIKSINLV